MNDLLFIAEIGSNWFGSIDIAKYLMDKAKESGATHAKLQLFKADDLYKPDWEWYKHAKLCELDYDTARILKNYADKINIGWFASVHTKEDIDFLVDIKAPFIKIKGSQSEDFGLIEYATKSGIDKIVSREKLMATKFREKTLYTTLKYPSTFNDIEFGYMEGDETYPPGDYNGFSDHTQGIQASLCAAMYENIRIFEKHFTVKLNLFSDGEHKMDETKTPDHCVSIYPSQFKEMVRCIRHIKQEK